ncbi:hypothetical protein MOQ_007592 [Trypanosoma cruzi marinkellei]|uniref:Uncharacterized protein n=1 Tax=Trypanosoma cruzi marinkellei TaxID=85056 RepID=K2MNH2_TRYCR|nr:hypothetical protein MOQ_007592 [Trypanosoma cruzi marinkellei]
MRLSFFFSFLFFYWRFCALLTALSRPFLHSYIYIYIYIYIGGVYSYLYLPFVCGLFAYTWGYTLRDEGAKHNRNDKKKKRNNKQKRVCDEGRRWRERVGVLWRRKLKGKFFLFSVYLFFFSSPPCLCTVPIADGGYILHVASRWRVCGCGWVGGVLFRTTNTKTYTFSFVFSHSFDTTRIMDGGNGEGCNQSDVAVASSAFGGALHPVELRHCVSLKKSPRMPNDEICEEEAVRSEVAVQLAEKVVVLRRKLQRREAEIQTLKLGIETGTSAATHSTAAATATTNASVTFSADGSTVESCNDIRNASSLTRELSAAAEQTVDCNSQGNSAELQEKLAEMEAQSVLWRQRVKEALRTSQKREQALLAENIALQKRLQELQGKLNEAMFRIEASTLKNARQTTKVNRHCQTNESSEDAESGDESYADDTTGMSNISSNTRPLRRRRRQSVQISTLPTSLHVVASSENLATTARATTVVTPTQTEISDSSSKSPSRFPYPPQPLVPMRCGNLNIDGGSNMVSPNYPMEICSSDPTSQAQSPPFIVAVHYNNSDGWSVQTKLCVKPGMTVAQLKEHCCSQFYDRYQMRLDDSKLCVRYYHEKARRHVVLSPYRELHSFACFQRCERENIPITLQLTREDNLSKFVHDTMNVANMSRVNLSQERAD